MLHSYTKLLTELFKYWFVDKQVKFLENLYVLCKRTIYARCLRDSRCARNIVIYSEVVIRDFYRRVKKNTPLWKTVKSPKQQLANPYTYVENIVLPTL